MPGRSAVTALTDFFSGKIIEEYPLIQAKKVVMYTEKTGVSNFECQNVDSQSELLEYNTFSEIFSFWSGRHSFDIQLNYYQRGRITIKSVDW